MTRLVLAAAVVAALTPVAARATETCVYVPNGDGGPAYVCHDTEQPGCLYGWLGAEAGLRFGQCD
ncbi:MAG TPA: hypothetical protein VF519_17815 [Mycobacteriales bacterium]|jgi:hypothetical protein